jgi:hypothetical protein
MAIAAMGACRRAWFVMQRAEEAIVPADNPFAKMGLKKLAPGQKKPETPTATWDELVAFRRSAVKLGFTRHSGSDRMGMATTRRAFVRCF